MKIISIACQNINSLRGKETHRLDFEAAPLDNCGLFAITGPTGAGKTTLLDAITLALYGRTPRQSNSRALISHGARESWAEVVYEVAAGRFLTRWSIQSKRTHKKPGDSLRDAHMEVSSWPDGKLLAQKTEKTIAQNEALTGMKYGQFTRSVLLAQGGFDEFLKAKDDEREKLLERITGIEIYTTLSGQAHDRHRAEEQREKELLAHLGAVQWLTPEELEQKTTEAAELTKTVDQAANTAEMLRQQHEWHEKLADLTRKAEAAAEAVAEAEAARTARQADLDRLAAHEQAEPFEQRWQQATAAADEARRAGEQRQKRREELTKAQKRHSEAREAVETAKTAWEIAEQNLALEKPPLEEARSQQPRLETLTKAAATALADWNHQQEAYAQAVKQLQQLRETTAANRLEVVRLTGWLRDNVADERLETSEIPLIENQVKAREKATEIYSELRKRQQTLLNQQQIAGQAAEDFSGNAALATEALTALAEEVVVWQQQHAGLLEGAQWRKAQLLLALDAIKTIHGRQYEQLLGKKLFAQHKDNLQPGHACPLCGALEHPVLKHGVDASAEAIAALETLVQDSSQQLQALIRQQQDNDKLLTILEPFPQVAPADPGTRQLDLPAALRSAQLLVRDLNNTPERQTKHEKERAQAKRSETDALEKKDFIGEQLAEINEQLAKIQDEGQKATQEIEQLAVRLHLAFDRKQPALFISLLQQRVADYKKALLRKNDLDIAVAGASAKLTAADETNEKLLVSCQQRELQYQAASQECEACAASILAAHPGYSSPQAALAYWQNAEKVSRQHWDTTQTTERACGAECSRLALLEAEETAAREFFQLKHDLLLDELSHQLPAAGLTASSAILDQLLPEAERPVLRKLQADLNGKVTQAVAHGQWCAEELEKTRQLALTTEPAEAVKNDFTTAQQHYLTLRDELAGLNKELTDDQAKREKHAVLGEQLNAQKAETRRWAAMYELLGSREKSKFSRFAQGLTLAHLVTLANHHLRQFNDRYELRRRDAMSLGLLVADSYDDCLRDVGTLSGGETFLVSLALALGLSELASNSARIDSLFIDEGFGTLDADTLDVALAALGSLRQRGKTIGIITHVDVDKLKDYIDTRIVVERIGQGSSRLRVLPEVAVAQPV